MYIQAGLLYELECAYETLLAVAAPTGGGGYYYLYSTDLTQYYCIVDSEGNITDYDDDVYDIEEVGNCLGHFDKDKVLGLRNNKEYLTSFGNTITIVCQPSVVNEYFIGVNNQTKQTVEITPGELTIVGSGEMVVAEKDHQSTSTDLKEYLPKALKVGYKYLVQDVNFIFYCTSEADGYFKGKVDPKAIEDVIAYKDMKLRIEGSNILSNIVLCLGRF